MNANEAFKLLEAMWIAGIALGCLAGVGLLVALVLGIPELLMDVEHTIDGQ